MAAPALTLSSQGKSDGLKAKLYGKYGKLVLQAAKAGGSDPSANRQLSVLLDQARRAGVPREILDRNLKLRSEERGAADVSEALYEIYYPGGTGYVCECLTDNGRRTVTDIWTTVKLNGKARRRVRAEELGSEREGVGAWLRRGVAACSRRASSQRSAQMAESGSVLFNFERRGELTLRGVSEDAAFDAAMEVGAADVEPRLEGGEVVGWTVVSTVEGFGAVRDGLAALDLEVSPEESGLTYRPLAAVEVEDDDLHVANEELYDRLLELDDVDAVYTTCDGVGNNT